MSGGHHHWSESFEENLRSGDHGPLSRAWLLAGNLARRLRPPHDCCGNYGEPGC